MVNKIHLRIGIAPLGSSLITLIIACSLGVPSESDGRKVLENVAKKDKDEVYKVNSFAKTNGVSDQAGGAYQLEFEADVECQKVNTPSQSSGVFNYTFRLIEPNSLDINCGQIGEKQKLKGALFFQKTEKGWRGRDGEVY